MGRPEELRDELRLGGVAAIHALRGTSESMHMECKRDLTKGQPALDALAKTASAFLNTEGGVLIWGVNAPGGRDNRAGLINEFRPIDNVQEIVEWLRSRTSGIVVPAPVGIEHIPIVGPGESSGFVVTYVPMSEVPPHRSGFSDGVYYLRSPASSFQMPHGVLAAMFGRRPAPSVRLLVSVLEFGSRNGSPQYLRLLLSVRNVGPVYAQAPFLTMREHVAAGRRACTALQEGSTLGSRMLMTPHRHERTAPFDASGTTDGSVLLAPGNGIAGFQVLVPHDAPFAELLQLSGTVGALGCPVQAWRMSVPTAPLVAVGAALRRNPAAGADSARPFAEVLTPETLDGGDYLHAL